MIVDRQRAYMGKPIHNAFYGKFRESVFREPRAACGAIVGCIGHFNPANPVHVRIRNYLGEENFNFLQNNDIFADDGNTRKTIADLKMRHTAAQNAVEEAMRLPEEPDWKQLARIGAAYPEFLGEVKKVYEAEKATVRPADSALISQREGDYKAEHADAVSLQKEFWQAQDDVMEAVAKSMIEIGEAEELFDRVERDEVVRVDEVLLRRPHAMQTIDAEISEFEFDEESKAKLVDVDLKPLEGFFSVLMKAVQAKARPSSNI